MNEEYIQFDLRSFQSHFKNVSNDKLLEIIPIFNNFDVDICVSKFKITKTSETYKENYLSVKELLTVENVESSKHVVVITKEQFEYMQNNIIKNIKKTQQEIHTWSFLFILGIIVLIKVFI